MRYVVAAIVGLATAAVTWAVLLSLAFVLGGSECDRAACNWLGEAIDENGLVAAIVIYGVALAAGAVSVRAVLRHR